jgi:hypothetical protein
MTHDEGFDEGPSYGPWVWSAYKAYHELLREKVKKRFEAKEGPWMDQLADLLVQLVDARWQGGRAGEKAEGEIRAKLDALLSQ